MKKCDINNPKTPEEKLIAELISNLNETLHVFVKLNRLSIDDEIMLEVLNNGIVGFFGKAIFALSEPVKIGLLKGYIDFVKKHINLYLDNILIERGIQ